VVAGGQAVCVNGAVDQTQRLLDLTLAAVLAAALQPPLRVLRAVERARGDRARARDRDRLGLVRAGLGAPRPASTDRPPRRRPERRERHHLELVAALDATHQVAAVGGAQHEAEVELAEAEQLAP